MCWPAAPTAIAQRSRSCWQGGRFARSSTRVPRSSCACWLPARPTSIPARDAPWNGTSRQVMPCWRQ
ncbi:UNVERIFIED_CONTAM: hypothetical protein NCL1_59373, partial [Trichonephila clavipes]